MARHIIMDQSGHKQIDFNKADVVELEKAERRFKELTTQGYIAAVSRGDGEHQLLRAFAPAAEQTMFIPQLKGG